MFNALHLGERWTKWLIFSLFSLSFTCIPVMNPYWCAGLSQLQECANLDSLNIFKLFPLLNPIPWELNCNLARGEKQ